MKMTITPCPQLMGETSPYMAFNPLDGELAVDLGQGIGRAWQPTGELADFTTLDSEQAMTWCRQNNILAACRNPLIDSLPANYFSRDHGPDVAWPLVKHELAGPKSDMVFARLQSPSDQRFLQVGVEFAAREGKKAVPVALTTQEPEDDEEIRDLDLNPFRWGGFVHFGGERVRASFIFDASEVCQESLSFRVAEDALRSGLTYLLKERLAELSPTDLLTLAAKSFCAWQFPPSATLQNGRALSRVYSVVVEPSKTGGDLPQGVAAQKIYKGVSLTDAKDTPLVQAELREDGSYEFTIYRPDLREYGPKLVLKGKLRQFVAAHCLPDAMPELTVDKLFADIQTFAPMGPMRLPKRS